MLAKGSMLQKTRCFYTLSLILLTLDLLGTPTTAQAMIDLELTQGIKSAVPIAIRPFVGQAMILPEVDRPSRVITHDLYYSGHFRIVHPEGAQPDRAPDYLVTGRVEKLTREDYRISFRLFSLYRKHLDSPLPEQKMILQGQYKMRVKSGQLRDISHRFSDQIYKAITGVDGAFSTHVAYVLVKTLNTKAGWRKHYQLEIADIDGHHPKTLLSSTQPIMSPAWSPDGKRLAYVSFEHYRSAIYVQAVEGQQPRHLIARFPGINGSPAWTPDGHQLTLVLSTTGEPKIYLLNLLNGHLHALTRGSAIDTEPVWFPDGKSFLFTSNRGGGPQIYRFWRTSGKIERMTFEGQYNARPSIAKNGHQIAFLHRKNGVFTIAFKDLSTQRTTTLTEEGINDSPNIAPNGDAVIYATHYNGRSSLGIVSTDNRVKLRLPAKGGDVQTPAWAPR